MFKKKESLIAPNATGKVSYFYKGKFEFKPWGQGFFLFFFTSHKGIMEEPLPLSLLSLSRCQALNWSGVWEEGPRPLEQLSQLNMADGPDPS